MSKNGNGGRVSLTLALEPTGEMRLTGSPGLTPELAVKMLQKAAHNIVNSTRTRIVGPNGQPILRTGMN